MTASTGFAAPLLTQTHAELRAELDRHARAVAQLQARIDALTAAGIRTRRQLFLDPATPDTVVDVALRHGQSLTAVELAALLTRPYRKELGDHVSQLLRAATMDLDSSSRDRYATRLEKIVDAILDTDEWPPATRILLLFSHWHTATLTRIAARCDTDPHLALMVGMHSGRRTWSKDVPSQVNWVLRNLGDNPWVTLGRGVEVGKLPADIERGFRDRLAALTPVDVAVRMAAELPARTTKGLTGIEDRVSALEVLVAGVGAPAQTARHVG